jgi:hypothetical protein
MGWIIHGFIRARKRRQTVRVKPPHRDAKEVIGKPGLALVVRGSLDYDYCMPKKNKAAQELGRLGGSKGGKARAANMTPEERSEAARKAVNARWEKWRRERQQEESS